MGSGSKVKVTSSPVSRPSLSFRSLHPDNPIVRVISRSQVLGCMHQLALTTVAFINLHAAVMLSCQTEHRRKAEGSPDHLVCLLVGKLV